MYDKTVTVFNRYTDRDDVIYWHPCVLHNVDLVIDRAANIAKTGLDSADTAKLHIRYTNKYVGTIGETFWNDKDGRNIFDAEGESVELIAETGRTIYEKIVDGKKYLQPKEWQAQTRESLEETVTFAEGDFFVEGEYSEQVVKDDDYDTRVCRGFYDYMNKKIDNVFLITNIGGPYTLIPHFEIGGK